MSKYILALASFALGFVTGAFIVFKKKIKIRKAIETSFKKDIAPSPPTYTPPETEEIKRIQADALEKKILYEEELSLIFKMGQEMFSNVTLENIAKIIVENATNVTAAQISTLLLQDKATGDFVHIYSKGVKKEFIDKMRFKKGESISGWVVLNKEILIKDNIENDKWFKEQNKGEYFVNSLVSIPLLAKEGVMGVLNISNKRSQQEFSEEDIAFLKGLTSEASLALQNASMYEQIQESYLRTITALAFALDARDAYTRQHSENVTKYAVAIAQGLNFRPADIEHIRRAGMLHDIGKIGIRDGVLLKPAKLNEDEYKDIKAHPLKGEAIVNALPFLKEEAKLIRHHHERFDGKGYPDGIAADVIEKGARILAVADSFDAMIENRVYRQALSLDATLGELKKNSGKQFDPEIVDVFIRVIEKNPGLLDSETKP